jgi:hypothetical protein
LSPVPDNTQIKSRLTDLQNKLKILENNNFGFSQLDFKISLGELQKAFGQLKSGESPGLDNISNEMLKVSQCYTKDCILKLCNAIFLSGM